jgi:hypothetical protein
MRITETVVSSVVRERQQMDHEKLVEALKRFSPEARQEALAKALAEIAESERRAAALARVADLDTDAIERLLDNGSSQ